MPSVISITKISSVLTIILIGFAFGAFLEGSAGFGAPVAITAAISAALGLNPLYAAGLCLIANTAPVAFGALGIPILVAGRTAGIDPMLIGKMAGRQLPLLSVFVPIFLVWLMDGLKGVRETWPAVLVAGGAFGGYAILLACTASMNSLVICITWMRWKTRRIPTIRRIS